MKLLNNDTAVLVFSRLPREEAAVKGYGKSIGKKGGLRLAEKLLRSTLHTAHSSGYPVFAIYSDRQSGRTFGERLTYCMEEVYRKGYEKIIVIGSDCPTLSAAMIRRAGQKLQAQNILAGPSSDGGLYLLGVHKESYSQSMLANISWCTASVFEGLQQVSLVAGLDFIIEEFVDDIDSFSDLLTWSKNHHRHSLTLLLSQLTSTIIRVCNGSPLGRNLAACYHRSFLFRGPPPLHAS